MSDFKRLNRRRPRPEDELSPDVRTTDEIEAAADQQPESAREALTGFPARPGVRR